MQERNPVEREHGEQADLERRLKAFYGPELREQHLPESSWRGIQAHLEPRRSTKRQRLRQWRVRVRRRTHRDRAPVPAYIQEAFLHLIHETRLPYPLPILRCSIKFRMQVPAVRISPLGRHNIKLILPPSAEWAVETAGLDVLLATGLARRHYMRKPTYMLLQLLFVLAIFLTGSALILYATHKTPFFLLPIAILLCGVVAWLIHIQGRERAFRADGMVVQWLGRNRACQGLHTLANRSRTSRRGRWGEPSLEERIHRVCRTRVTLENDQLMLVR